MRFIGISFIICSLLYSILTLILFVSKKHLNTLETKLYQKLMLVNVFNLVIELCCFYCVENRFEIPVINFLVTRGFLVVLLLWNIIFTLYLFYVSFEKDLNVKEKYRKFKLFELIILFVCSILAFVLPMYYQNSNNITYSYGLSTDLISVVYVFNLIIIAFCVIKNIKKINFKKIFPICIFTLFIIICVVIRNAEPGLNLITSLLSLTTVLMFHTIENPDVKLINQLELAKDSAEKANHAKTDFLSSMSHEIRTPLNAIVGFSQCIENATNLEEAKEDAKDIVMASNNLLEIVNGILDISKIEADKMEIVNTEYSIKEILDNLVKLIIPRIGDKDIELKTDFAVDLPEVLYGDSGKVKQIITNVLTNAAKYTDKGEINFNVNCVNEKDKCRLIISIKDTGRGIKTEQIDKLFNKFQRLDEDKNTTTEGTGLGLAITKRLVEMMGGKIVVQSEYGEGSIFTIYLTQEIGNSIYKKEEVIEENLTFDNKKVLLVDDNKLNIKVGTKILKEYNLDITPCESGFECINKIENNNKYDIILLDIMMPKMSGVETLKRLKQIDSFDTPVIALTADAIQGRENKYLEVGFSGYLSKPIEHSELKKILSKYLNIKEKRIEEQKENKSMNVEYLKENNIDVDSSLDFLGDMETYNETLRDFLIENETRIPKMKEHLSNEDASNYAILAHALKSDSKYLGFKKLAELALNHELKGKDNDLEYIKENYNELMLELKNVIDIVKKYLGDE